MAAKALPNQDPLSAVLCGDPAFTSSFLVPSSLVPSFLTDSALASIRAAECARSSAILSCFDIFGLVGGFPRASSRVRGEAFGDGDCDEDSDDADGDDADGTLVFIPDRCGAGEGDDDSIL